MMGTEADTLYCHVCGEALHRGDVGHSLYELGCDICQAGYHVEGDSVSYVLSTFVMYHEPPVVVPLSTLRTGKRG